MRSPEGQRREVTIMRRLLGHSVATAAVTVGVVLLAACNASPSQAVGSSHTLRRPASKTGIFRPIPVAPASNHLADIPAGKINRELIGPFSSADYLTKTAWWNRFDGVTYDVYAGAEGRDLRQGVVVVLSGSRAASPSLEAYPSPVKDGMLTLTRAHGPTLTLTARDGAVFTFDVLTHAFLSLPSS